jgi:NDP-sugar pyrophosphorylase family protein
MKAIIRCGGLGSRLRPLTYFVPKPLIKIGDKTVVEHIIEYLRKSGIREIAINIRYKPEQFLKKLGSSVMFIYEKGPTDEEETIGLLYEWRKNDYCVVINGDTLTNLKLSEMMKMANGDNVKFMDGETYAGVRVIAPGYYPGDSSCLYQNKNYWWIDVGSWEGLRKAKRLYEKSSSLPKL